MKKALQIILYFIGGLNVFEAIFISTYSRVNILETLTIMKTPALKGLIYILIALAINRFRDWKFPVGVILLTATAFNLLGVLWEITLELSPELVEILKTTSTPESFERLKMMLSLKINYIFGGIINLVTLTLGLLLARPSTKTPI